MKHLSLFISVYNNIELEPIIFMPCRFLHIRVSDDRRHNTYHGDIIRDVQTVAELLLEPLITTLLVMDRDILSTITVNNAYILLTIQKQWFCVKMFGFSAILSAIIFSYIGKSC